MELLQTQIWLHIDLGRFPGRFFGQFGNFVPGDGVHALHEVAVLHFFVPRVPDSLPTYIGHKHGGVLLHPYARHLLQRLVPAGV